MFLQNHSFKVKKLTGYSVYTVIYKRILLIVVPVNLFFMEIFKTTSLYIEKAFSRQIQEYAYQSIKEFRKSI